MRVYLLVAASISFLACGDNIEGGFNASDAGVIDFQDRATAFIVAGDFTSGTGIASTIGIPSLEVTSNVIDGVVSSDPVLRYHDDKLYIVNRFGHDNITILDAASKSLITQISTGAGTNPQDVAVVGTKLYIAALGAPGILVIDTESPTDIQTIDLASLDANDGIPDCNSIALAGDNVIATCGLLQSFSAVGPGKVVVIDTTDDTLSNTFDLTTANPFGLLQATPADAMLDGDLLIGTVADFFTGLTTGCVERISVGETPESKGCLVSNADLGGYATGYAYGSNSDVYISVTSGFGENGPEAEVRRYDLQAEALDRATVNSSGQSLFDLARCPTGEWLFADSAGGIRVYGNGGTEFTTMPLDIGLPPIDNGIVCY